MNRVILLCLIGLFSLNLTAQDLKAYQFYNKKGEAVDFGQVMKSLAKYDVVLFGEHHNNSIVHWLQLETTKALYDVKGKKLKLGAEMFERDNQEAYNLYLMDSISDKELAEQARLWPNHKTDYKPLLDFAKEKDLEFIATNIPRRYASVVAKNGLDSLEKYPKEERKWMMKFPVEIDMETPGYPEILEMMKEHNMGKPEDFVAAQSVKDATMAESIWKNSNRRHLFLHFNGDYHSKEYGGIYKFLKEKKKRWKVAVISMAESSDSTLALPEEMVMTEFILVVPADMTKTY